MNSVKGFQIVIHYYLPSIWQISLNVCCEWRESKKFHSKSWLECELKERERQTKDTGRSSGWNFQHWFMISCRRGGHSWGIIGVNPLSLHLSKIKSKFRWNSLVESEEREGESFVICQSYRIWTAASTISIFMCGSHWATISQTSHLKYQLKFENIRFQKTEEKKHIIPTIPNDHTSAVYLIRNGATFCSARPTHKQHGAPAPPPYLNQAARSGPLSRE
jgi:hypothetical protein